MDFLIKNARRTQVDTDCEVIGINNPIYSPLCVIPSILNNPHDPNQTHGQKERGRYRYHYCYHYYRRLCASFFALHTRE